MPEFRRILLDGSGVQVIRRGDALVAVDGREIGVNEAVHLPPANPRSHLAADIARTITLSPGDLLFSGTPANSRPVEPGDVVEVEVDGFGRLRNTIVTGPTPIRTDVGAQPTQSEEAVSTALGGDWEFRGIRTPSKDLYPSTVTERA